MAKLAVTKVDGVHWTGGILNTYILAVGIEPLMAPSLYLLHLAQANKSDNTIAAYASALKLFFEVVEEWDEGGCDWKKIGEREMSGYLFGYLKEQRNLSEKSIELHITALNSFYNWAYKHGFAIDKHQYQSCPFREKLDAIVAILA